MGTATGSRQTGMVDVTFRWRPQFRLTRGRRGPLFQRGAAPLGNEEDGRDDVDHVDGGEQRDRGLERIGGAGVIASEAKQSRQRRRSWIALARFALLAMIGNQNLKFTPPRTRPAAKSTFEEVPVQAVPQLRLPRST